MSPGASIADRFRHGHGHRSDTAWASFVAGLFALLAALSFAIDQSVTLSDLPAGHAAPLPSAGTNR